MPDYAIVNLLEIEDSVGGRVPGMQGRFSRKYLGSRDLGVSHWRYAPGTRNPDGHSHREQEEAYVVVAGSGRVRLDDKLRDIRLWDVIRVAPEVVRAFEAGPDGLELIAVGGPKPRRRRRREVRDAMARRRRLLTLTPAHTRHPVYVADNGHSHHILAFDVLDGRRLAGARPFATSTVEHPDGLKVDADGRVYASAADGVRVLDPGGEQVGGIDVPGAVNFTFGGADGNVLFITTDDAIWAAVLDVSGPPV